MGLNLNEHTINVTGRGQTSANTLYSILTRLKSNGIETILSGKYWESPIFLFLEYKKKHGGN